MFNNYGSQRNKDTESYAKAHNCSVLHKNIFLYIFDIEGSRWIQRWKHFKNDLKEKVLKLQKALLTSYVGGFLGTQQAS